MFETIFIILICVLLLGGLVDFIFDALSVGVKIFISIVLIIASIWFGIKLLLVMIPWMFVITCIAFVVGIIWLIKAFKH